MKTTESQQWLHLIGLTVSGVAAFGIVYAAATLFISPAKDVRDYYAGVVHFVEERIPGQTPAVVPPPGEVYKDFFGLPVNETKLTLVRHDEPVTFPERIQTGAGTVTIFDPMTPVYWSVEE